MNKAYHRKWYQTQGRFLAIMRYHDRIDPGGRLVGERADMPKFLGSPLFLYREVLRHFAGWFWATVTLRGNSAFYHETRLRRFVSFILTRYRMEYGSASVRSHLADIGQVFRRRLAPRTSRSRQRT
jgi:hypothetical protein